MFSCFCAKTKPKKGDSGFKIEKRPGSSSTYNPDESIDQKHKPPQPNQAANMAAPPQKGLEQ